MATRYRADIDGLRAVAVILVLLFHVGFSAFKGGFIGVDVFFVISGFLITGIIADGIEDGTFSFRGFYIRRIRRIAPAFFLVLFVTYVAAWIILPPENMASFGRSALSSVLLVSNVFFANSLGYFDPDARLQPLLHIWSLSIEEQFYLVFPLLLYIAMRIGRIAALVVCGLAFVMSLSLAIGYTVAGDVKLAFFSSFPRFWEILAGSLLALAGRRVRLDGTIGTVAAFAGLALIVATALLVSDRELPFVLNIALPVTGAALIIAACHDPKNPVARILALPPLPSIGKISYSLYLIHWPIVVMCNHLLIYINDRRKFLIIAISLALAWLSWHFVEQPCRRRGFSRTDRLAFPAVFSAIGLFALVSYAATADGFAWRFGNSADFETIMEAKVTHPHWYECVVEYDKDRIDDWCHLPENATEPPSIMMWGDSHATAFVPAVEAYAASTGQAMIVASMPACPPFSGVWIDSHPDQCKAFNDTVLQWLDSAPRMTVIIAARWSFYSEGSAAAGEALRVPITITDKPSGTGDLADAKHLFSIGLEAAVKRVSQHHNVLILKQVPTFPQDVPRAMLNTLRFGTPAPAQRKANHQRLVAFANADIDRLAEKYGVAVADPEAILCPDEFCRFAVGPSSLYYDDDHLSTLGAQSLVPMLEKSLGVFVTGDD